MPDLPPVSIAIVGAGNVGLGLAQLFVNNGFPVHLGSRNPRRAQKLVTKHLQSGGALLTVTSPEQAVRHADITVLAVSDDAIAAVCEALAGDFKAASVVAHCSGALDSRELQSARLQNCEVCSLHPLNTFPNIDASLKLLASTRHNTYLFCEGDKQALKTGMEVFGQIGFRCVEVNRKSKVLYHAACVFACNYLTALMEVSLQTAEAADLDREMFWQALQPLIESSLTNIAEHGTTESLSGPIARGDDATVDKHIHALKSVSADLQLTYADLGSHALRLARQRGQLDAKQIAAMQIALKIKPD